jgi:hypothetical protein
MNIIHLSLRLLLAKNDSKNISQIFGEFFFSKEFHMMKKRISKNIFIFQLFFPIIINYLAGKYRPCILSMVIAILLD